MHFLQPEFIRGEEGILNRRGIVIPLEDIFQAIDIVPFFGEKIDPSINSDNCLDVCRYFLLNDHGDKEMYHRFDSLFL